MKSIIMILLICLTVFSCPIVGGWETTNPGDIGLDSAYLDNLKSFIEDNCSSVNTLIIKDGYIALEHSPSGPDSITNILSATKSVTATLIGIAIQQGFIGDVDDLMVDYFVDWQFSNNDEWKRSISIKNLLTMTAGFDYNEHNSSYTTPGNSWYEMSNSPDMVQYMLDLPIVYEPGSHWEYSTGTSNLLGAIIEQSSGMALEIFAQTYLFDPLDIDYLTWWRDRNGIHSGTGFSVSTRALASISYLYLNQGKLGELQLLPESYVEAVLSNKISVNEYYSTQFNGYYGYSYQWWNFEASGIYFMWGSNGELMHTRSYVIPEYNIIAVFSGYTDMDYSEFLINEYLLPAIGNVSNTADTHWNFVLLFTIVSVVKLRRKYWNKNNKYI
ncbi:MAG: serine hydrolase [Candidatus Heimdallarchaeota archaeon]|nr:serine hydrolase [Candidatus Heimdallarchaeota archaeon]